MDYLIPKYFLKNNTDQYYLTHNWGFKENPYLYQEY